MGREGVRGRRRVRRGLGGGSATPGGPPCLAVIFETPVRLTSHLKTQPPLHFLPFPICTGAAGGPLRHPRVTAGTELCRPGRPPGPGSPPQPCSQPASGRAPHPNQETPVGQDTGHLPEAEGNGKTSVGPALHHTILHLFNIKSDLVRPRFHLLNSHVVLGAASLD